MSITVRQATSADADLVSSLNTDVQALHAEAIPWRFKAPGPDSFPPTAAAALLAGPSNFVFVAELDGTPIGYAYAEASYRPDTPFHHAHELMHLHHICVRPEHRRSGAGHALMDAVRALAKAKGIDHMTLDVWSFNETARAFFSGQGFSPYMLRMWTR